MEYIVAGYTMLNDLHYPDGCTLMGHPGGSFYSAAGIKLWRDSVAYVGTAGEDFQEYYGEYFRSNGITTKMSLCLPKTLYYVLDYAENGHWDERCKYGEEYEKMAQDKGRLTPEMFEPLCGSDTKGIYLEASLSAKIVNDFIRLKELMPNGVLMWEINGDDLANPDAKARILELIEQVDIYSINMNEAKSFFRTDDSQRIIAKMQEIGKPCFFRLGTAGACLLTADNVVFCPSVDVDKSVNATGCGNCSTAAALVGWAEGLPAAQTVAMANISAAYNARQIGPWPLADENTRREAEAKMKRILDSGMVQYQHPVS